MSGKGFQVKAKPQPVVVMESEVARKIRQHSRSSMKAEVCGVLIGSNERERTLIEACIPGVNAAQGGAHVTFTQDTWEHIYKIKDQQFPDDKIVGWYHSHPGFGVFLSEHDLFIQENFFSSPQQVAWVYDPHTDEEGCFGWVGGKIEKLSGVRFGYLKSIEPSESAATEVEEGDDDGGLDPQVRVAAPRSHGEPSWVIWMWRIMSHVFAVVLGFGMGYLFVGWRVGPLFRVMDQKIQEYQAVLQQLEPMLRECQEKFGNSSASQGGGPVDQKSPARSRAQGQQRPHPQPSAAPPDSAKGNNGKH
jgi:proteasome lid subunit RPN8/RPN11